MRKGINKPNLFSKEAKKEEYTLKAQIDSIAILVKEQMNINPNASCVAFEGKAIRIKRLLSQNGRLGVTNVLVGSETNAMVFYVLYRESKVLSVLDSSFKQTMFSLEKEHVQKIDKLVSLHPEASMDNNTIEAVQTNQTKASPLKFYMGGSPHDSSIIPKAETVSIGCSFNIRIIKGDDGR